MKKALWLAPLALLAACKEAPVMEIINPDRVWHLQEIDGAPFGDTATIAFPKEGEAYGKAPCNQWFTTLEAPLPAFKPGPIGATMMACENLDQERVFFNALERATKVEVTAEALQLLDDSGVIMVFTPE